MKRAQWIDSCRFFAIFVIMVTHFLDKVCPAALMLWETPPTSWLLYGLTGKFSVAFFFVLLGYFASKPSSFSPGSFLSYTLRRYCQFAFYILLCSFVFVLGCYGVTWLFHSPDDVVLRVISDGFKYNLIYLLRDSFLFEANYNATLWCMQQLFLASLVCKALACLPERLSPALRLAAAGLLIVVLMLADAGFCVWICAAVLGYILRLLLEYTGRHPLPGGKLPFALLAIAALVLIKLRMPESVLQYSLQSVAAFLLIYIQFQLPGVQRVLSRPPAPWLGGISIGLFVVHTPINSLLYSSFYSLCLKFIPSAPAGLLYFFLSLGLCIFAAWLMSMIYSVLAGRFAKRKVSV